MPKETVGDLTVVEFGDLVTGFIERGDDRIEPSTFLHAAAELDRKQGYSEVELAGRLVNGDVIFDSPSALPVGTNTLYIGSTKVTLRLRTEDDHKECGE